MQVPLPDTYPMIQKKRKFSVTGCFLGHFKVESRVTSVAWATTIPSQLFWFYCSKLLLYIGKVGKIRLKLVLGHLRGLPGAPKSAKKALCSSGIKGKPDHFFCIPVTPIKLKIIKILCKQLFSRMYCISSKRYFMSSEQSEQIIVSQVH
jgi:hypothetical protein